MFCPNCGGQTADGGEFCSQCGKSTTSSAPPSPDQPLTEPPPPDQPLTEPPQEPSSPAPMPPPSPAEPLLQQPMPPPQYVYQQPAEPSFLADVYTKSFGFLSKKPILLWGLSLLFTLMTTLAMVFGVFPIIWLPIVLVLELGMVNVFLCGYRGRDISAMQLFEGFGSKFFRNAGGMGWRVLWLLIWGLIPIVGIIMAIVKFYSYRFVPYIMLAEPDITATEALKKSMIQTDGYKGKMFLADFLIGLAVAILTIIFFFVLRIPFIGFVLTAIYYIILVALLPLVIGTLEAVYYDKISKEKPVN